MSTAATSLEQNAAQLAAIAGAEHTRLAGENIIVSPANASEIASILRFANEQRLPVMPAGSAGKLGWGNPVAANILLSLRRMAAVREHSWQDMTCTVEAGCPWSTLESALAQHGQMVALDPLWPERSTVGGVTATNDSGAMRLRYGSLRDLILGMTIVLADGTIAKSGGKVVKNVAGYDLHKLMTGSFGTLGIITEVNFRLHPLEQHARTWTAIAPDAWALEEPLAALLDSHLVPSAIQIRARKQACSLDIRIASRPESLSEHGEKLQQIFGELPLSESNNIVWNARQDLFAGTATVFKISVLPGEICALLAELQEWAAAGAIEIITVAQAGGVMTVAFPYDHEAALSYIEPLRERVRTYGGSVVALQFPDEFRGRVDVWGCDSTALPLMREIKRRFDPNCILNPGRFVGNI